MELSRKNTGVGCHSLLQGIFLTQGSNLGLLALQANSLPSEPPRKPPNYSKFLDKVGLTLEVLCLLPPLLPPLLSSLSGQKVYMVKEREEKVTQLDSPPVRRSKAQCQQCTLQKMQMNLAFPSCACSHIKRQKESNWKRTLSIKYIKLSDCGDKSRHNWKAPYFTEVMREWMSFTFSLISAFWWFYYNGICLRQLLH